MSLIEKFGVPEYLLLCAIAGVFMAFVPWGLTKVVKWAKGRPAGAYLILALFPLVSILPIPPSEIEKLQRIKQEEVKRKEDSGDPFDENQ